MTSLPQHKKREIKLPSPKAVVLREEFVALTQDPLSAIVLGQLLYWTQRVKDFDLFLQEERFFNSDCNVSPRHGWIYKTANDLIEETMICVDRTTMRRYLKLLMDRGWLEERSHPKNKWDKTSQYRLNIRKLQEDLLPLGFDLPGIELLLKHEFIHKNNSEELISDPSAMAEISKGEFSPSSKHFATSKEQNIPFSQKSEENTRVQNDPSKGYNPLSNGYTPLSEEEIAPSNVTNSPLYIQRLQTEIKNRDYPQRASAREDFSDFEDSISDESLLEEDLPDEPILNEPLPKLVPDKSLADESVAAEMLKYWKRHVIQNLPPASAEAENKKFHLAVTRKDQLEALFAFHFQNDMRLWERFCLRVKASNFMMGGGESGWYARLDWILRDGNILKALAGNYDNSKRAESRELKLEKLQANPVLDAEKAAIIASIKDPTWKNWCTQLAAGVRLNDFKMLHQPLSALELQQIAHAWFLEVEDDRLVWIGSYKQMVLDKIDALRLKINWVFATEYPNARTFRTRLQGSYPSSQSSTTGDSHA